VKNQNRQKKAFGLIELSIVLVVLSIVIAASLTAKVVEIKTQEIKQNSIDINLLYQAIGQYVAINKKLPCPASLAISIADSTLEGANYGKSVGQDGDCQGQGVFLGGNSNNLVYGMIPVNEIGLTSKYSIDSYNNKIIYIVDRRLTSKNNFDIDYPNPVPVIKVYNYLNQDSSSNSEIKADFLIMSLGKNNHGAFLAKSTKPENSSFDLDEIENHLDAIYQFNDVFVANSSSQNFDDKLIIKSRDDLIKDFNLADIIRCKAKNTPELLDENENLFTIWQENGSLGQFVTSKCPANYDVGYVARKCENYGRWGSLENHCQKLDMVDGSWNKWSSWSNCSKSNNGLTSRSRNCDNPTPRGLGKKCEGIASEQKNCNIEIFSYNQGSWAGFNRLRHILTKNNLNKNDSKIYKIEFKETLESLIEDNNGYYKAAFYDDNGNLKFSHVKNNISTTKETFYSVYDFDQFLSIDRLELQIYTAKNNPYRVNISDVEIIVHYIQE